MNFFVICSWWGSLPQRKSFQFNSGLWSFLKFKWSNVFDWLTLFIVYLLLCFAPCSYGITFKIKTTPFCDLADEGTPVPYEDVLVGLRTLFSDVNQMPRLIVWDAKWWHRVSKELLHVPLPSSNLFDPGIHGWLAEPDGGRPSLRQLVSNSCLTSAFLSLGYDLSKLAN